MSWETKKTPGVKFVAQTKKNIPPPLWGTPKCGKKPFPPGWVGTGTFDISGFRGIKGPLLVYMEGIFLGARGGLGGHENREGLK